MLNAHELTTLMLIYQSPEQVDMNRTELDVLSERQLVIPECSAEGYRCRVWLIDTGRSVLRVLDVVDCQKRVTPGSACRDVDQPVVLHAHLSIQGRTPRAQACSSRCRSFHLCYALPSVRCHDPYVITCTGSEA